MQQIFLGLGAVAKKSYVDDLFSTYVYEGNNSTLAINNGLDLATEGGMIWVKNRDRARDNCIVDTERGIGKRLETNKADAQDVYVTTKNISSFTSTGFTLGVDEGHDEFNRNEDDYTSWSFRKAKGFFDVVTYTGNGADDRAISHSLGSIPGMIIVKALSDSSPWTVYHREIGATKYLYLNDNQAAATDEWWADTTPTASNFYVQGTRTNANNTTFVAYVFAGGESTQNEAVSVDFDDDDGLDVAASSDFNFGTGQFCIECWVYLNDAPSTGSPSYARVFQLDGPTGNSSFSNLQVTINPSNNTIHAWAYGGGNPVAIDGTKYLKKGWHHIAVVRDSNNLITQYVDGTPDGSVTATTNFNPNSGSPRPRIGSYDNGGTNGVFNGKISNLRVTVGEPVYTSAFKPSTTPLTTSSQVTSSSNVKLLCCNNSSTTGSTTTSGTITANGNPTASTDSPFDDPAGFVLGDAGDQNVIKCGSYVGNATANHEIHLGWEPQWWLVKKADAAQNWQLLDSMRGWVNDGNDEYLVPNNDSAESGFNFGNPTATGFNLSNASSNWQNEDGVTYVYMAIRRSDGYVGKPIELGTSVFAMDATISVGVFPQFTSGFPVDFSLTRNPTGSGTYDSWHTGARLLQGTYQLTATSGAWASGGNFQYDYNDGIFIGNWTNYMSWMWKRHAGFEVQAYTGVTGTQYRAHQMGVTPEMIWVKARTGSNEPWCIGHKDLTGGFTSHHLRFDTNSEFSNDQFAVAPTSTHWSTASGGLTNNNGGAYIAMLFASTDVSKVGSYTGDGTSNGSKAITVGFQPRFVIIKSSSYNGGEWQVLDTTRGIDNGLQINSTNAQSSDDFIDLTSTGFTMKSSHNDVNGSSQKYIYYAHA